MVRFSVKVVLPILFNIYFFEFVFVNIVKSIFLVSILMIMIEFVSLSKIILSLPWHDLPKMFQEARGPEEQGSFE